MRKRLFSLLCVLALCLGLLPVTALAAEGAPSQLYVGNYQITSSDTTTYLKADSTEGSLVQGSENDWTVKYEPSSATLTLKKATIKTTHDSAQDAVIYAESSLSSAVSLTIVLQGDNTINCDSASYGIYVNAEASANSYGTDASLTIKSDGNGSLEVSGSQYGISVKSGSGNASLTIENASVDAKTTAAFSYYAGVYVRSSAKATSSPHLSLAVNGGSLTASGGESSDGIQFNVGSSQATGATTSLTVTDHAIVDARNGGISASRISETLPTPTPTDGNSSGIVFDGTEGTVYGDVTLDESLTINQGETLTIPEGSSLNCNEKLTNNGTLVNAGGTLSGTPSGNGKIENKPTIDTQPTSQTVEEGATATFTVAATGENLSYQWQQKTSGSDWADIPNATSATYAITNTTTDMSGTQYRCVVSNSAGSVTSNAATLTVNQYIPPTYTISADVTPADAGTVSGGGSYAQGDTVTLTATPNSGYHFVRWEENGTEVSTSATYTFTASHDCALTAVLAQNSSGGGGGSRPDPTPTPSQQAVDKLEAAKDGETVEVTLPEGKTTLDKAVFEELAGRDVTLVLNLEDAVSWTIYGLDLPETASFADTDMGVRMDAGSVPAHLLNAITGAVDTVQMTLAHDGDFGFPLTLTAPLGEENEGYWANLYYYDEDAETLTFQTSAKIDDDGSAALPFTHASQYVIVIDDRDHTPKDFPFVDVTTGDWCYEAVDYVYQRDLMTGTDEAHFTPDGTASRAMVATILWRMAGEPQVDYAMDFADVPTGTWYTEAVRWAAAEGIVTGYSAEKFGPDDPVTREQFAVMLYRYAQTLGEGFTGNWSFPLNFPDAAQVSDYAYEALCWLTMENVIQGMEDGGLHPQDTTTRAQLATMLMRFSQSIDA